MRSISALVLALSASLTLAGYGSAQETAPPAHLIVQTGLVQFELEGEGYSPMLAARAAIPIATVLMLEGGVLAARPGQDSGTTTLLIPEAQVQLAVPFTRTIPYIGLGVGAAIDMRGEELGGTQTWVTFSGAVGAKYWIRERIGAQLEYRARGIGDDAGATNEFGLGLVWQI